MMSTVLVVTLHVLRTQLVTDTHVQAESVFPLLVIDQNQGRGVSDQHGIRKLASRREFADLNLEGHILEFRIEKTVRRAPRLRGEKLVVESVNSLAHCHFPLLIVSLSKACNMQDDLLQPPEETWQQ